MKRFISVLALMYLSTIIHILYSSDYPILSTLKHLLSIDGIFFIFIVFVACLIGGVLEILFCLLVKKRWKVHPWMRLFMQYLFSLIVYSGIVIYLTILTST